MKKSKLSLLLVLSLVLSMFLAACSGGTDKNEGKDKNEGNNAGNEEQLADEQVLNVLESAEIPSMDSVMSQDVLSFTMLNATNEGLYRLDADQKVIPGVAEAAPTYNDDKTVITIKLRQDTKWSNGDPVTANDFVFAWQRAIDPKVAAPYGAYFMEGKIKNASEIVAGKAKLDDLGIKAIDDYTLEITLVRALPYIESYLTFPLFYPQNKKFVEAEGANYAKDATHLLYNGPFKMTKWDGPTGTEWVLEKNADYVNAKDVTLEKINFNVSKDPQASANAYTAGEADITPKLAQAAILSQFEGQPDLLRYQEPSIWWLKMNEKNKALKNVNIRKAIALTVDKKALTEDVLANGSIPADFLVPKGFSFLDGKDFRDTAGTYLSTNKEEAKKLWEQGLKETGLKEVSFTYVGQDTETSKVTDAFVKDQLEKNLPGLKITIEAVPFKIRIAREDAEDYDLLMGGWGPDYADPMTYMDLWVTGGGQNHMSYSNPEFDKLINSASEELVAKPQDRWKALQDAEKILLEDDAAIAPLYQRSVNLLINPKVKGFAHHAFGPDYSYQWIKITNK
ncbi:peptide ABC transporter substrate-binding protein [Bacillus sp. ISL-40]|uniref:peptide ABC transporter substrate-binding protein n=1 Tax=unclassified Bacillus (in: firmicutes) TaxID=185979 RepID=UPI001BEC1BDC|nr:MULTISPECIES: peptide ABC transporter substrate-binding protein [unclassified Bacillus (in: firmicutes)]MBT2697122.1 peptide ABC transporter substrate-binding protein [Bacillus sp. ISL-40]MBT2721714.1 peptide ABC transporter substrate-binding protein [Bacillus sp. ISL-46]MBT2740337.1 peptide ABC transporter substrate-binding protein [Bacillus sp. ISL-77]